MAAAKVRVLVDLNVIIDVAQHREPFYERSAAVLDVVARGEALGWLAAHGVTTLYYIIARTRSRAAAVQSVTSLLESFTVATVNDKVMRAALSLGWKDFEDAVQMAAASEANVDYFITRNTRDFETGTLPVVQPAAFLALLKSS